LVQLSNEVKLLIKSGSLKHGITTTSFKLLEGFC
jgi:hypothetical protein